MAKEEGSQYGIKVTQAKAELEALTRAIAESRDRYDDKYGILYYSFIIGPINCSELYGNFWYETQGWADFPTQC